METLKKLLDPRVWWTKWSAANWKVKLGVALVVVCLAYAGGVHAGMLEVPALPGE